LPPLTLDNLTGQPIDGEETPPIEVVEEVTETAVAIAEIEAGKEIAIAEINADLQRELDDNFTERETAREHEREISWQEMDEKLTALQATTLHLSETVELLKAQVSTPQPSPEVETVETLTQPEPLSIPQSIADATSETPMAAIGESVAESLAAEEVQPARRRRRAI